MVQRSSVLSALLGVLLIAPCADAEVRVIAGLGPARSDCFVSWVVDHDGEVNRKAARRARLVCQDGLSPCDVDGSPDESCTFRLQICFGSSTASTACVPESIATYHLKQPSRRAARRHETARANRAAILDAVGALDRPIMPGQCTGEVNIRVPVRKNGRAGKVVLKSRVRALHGRDIDKDIVRLRCEPAMKTATLHHRRAVILTSDFTNTGSFSTVTLDEPRAVRADLGSTHSDAVGRVFQGRLYVVNRLGQDNLQVVNPISGTSLTACSIGNGSNPQDIAFASDSKAYVSRLRDGIVTIVDPSVPRTCRGFKRGLIDLDRFADADGSPEIGRMLTVGDRLYVAVLRLDRNRGFVPAATGLVAVIDTTTDELVDVDSATPEIDAISLTGRNPFGMAYDSSSERIWVWETGSFFVTDDGGIEAINPTTNRAEGFIIREADLGGTVTVAVPYSATRAFAVVADEDFRNHLVAFSPETGEVLDVLRSAPSFFPDVAVNDRGEVWLADRTLRAPGIRIFDAESGGELVGPIDVGLPPVSILFLN